MSRLILFPTHEEYCKKCIYSNKNGSCSNEQYKKNSYYVNCVWKRCKYRKEYCNGSSKQGRTVKDSKTDIV